MKEKTTDTEGHQIKVGQDQHKPFASPANPASKPFVTSSSPVKSGKESSKSNTSGLSPANNNSNFDDDYNEWDISIGDLIIDLDADIERQSEGDKSVTEGKPSEPLKPTGSLRNSPGELAKSSTVMSSSFKSGRVISLSSGSTNATSGTTGVNSNPVPANSIVKSTNGGGSSVHLHRHGHGQSNNQRNYPVPNSGANSSLVKPVATSVSATNASQVEHQAKGLKMKIKRKSVGGKVSEINHEIVSSDTSPQSCKSYMTSFDHGNNTVNPNSVASTTAVVTSNQASIIGSTTTQPTTSTTLTINTNNSVITANADGVSTPSDDLFSSKSSKHSSKNKSGHRDKKDKSRLEKDRFNLSLNSSPLKIKSEDDSVSPTLTNSQANIPNLTLKYSPSSAVIIKSEDTNKTVNNVRKIKVEDSISERQDVGTMTSIGTITEPDCLGPCEPGTSVTLEGIVWQETDNGILVVNITWRGKTYVGTLLDCTKHDWAPPRLCDSPTSDIESKSLKNTRGKRARGCFADPAIDTRSVTSKLRNGKGRRTANSGYIPSSPAKGDALNSSKRKNRPGELELNTDDSGKRTKVSTIEIQPDSPTYIICPEPNCSKKYRTGNGLKYHQSHAHVGSSCNINDSQDFEASGIEGAKGDLSDNEFPDSIPHSPLKAIASDKTKGEICKFKPISTENCKLDANSDQGNSSSVDSRQLIKINTNDLLESNNTNPNGSETEVNVNSNNNKLSGFKCSKDKLSDMGPKRIVDDEAGIGNESSTIGLEKEAKTEDSVEQLAPMHCNKFGTNNELEKVASPAYSDISDDNNTNDNTSELLNLASAQIEKSAAESPSLEKPAGALNNFNLAPFPSYSFSAKKPSETHESPLNSDSITDKQPFPYHNHLYRFGDTKFPENSNHRPATCNSPANKLEGETFSNKESKSGKENSEFVNNNKEPIAELQNLKNRIQNFAFDQGSLYDGQKPKFPHQEIEKDKLKEKAKHSPPQSTKPPKEVREDKERSKTDEGVKPTMETTGPPPPTNGYYYNPSFLPHPYAPLSAHFDPMFRGTAMNHMVMGGAYGPGPGSPFIPTPIRYSQAPPMGSLEGLPLQPNVSRPSVPPPSTSSSIAKTSVHHHMSKHSERPGLLSPSTSVPTSLSTSSSHSSAISYHKSPNKEFSSGLSGIPTSLPSGTSVSEARSLAMSNAVSSAMHQPPPSRHPLQASHLPYPMYDPFHAMIHTSNSVPMHPFTPK